MWYKIAKQGSVWSRIAPDAEEQFDKLLDEATVIIRDRKTIDIKKLNKLFQNSNLSKLVVRFLAKNLRPTSKGYFQRSRFDNIEILGFFQKIVPSFLANQIVLQKNRSSSYMELRGTLKHELGHAITDYTIPYKSEKELYVQPGKISAKEMGKNIAETNILMLYFNIKQYCLEKNSEFKQYLKTRLGDSIFDEFLNKTDTFENKKIIKEIYDEFMDKVLSNEINISEDEKNILINIGKKTFETIMQTFSRIPDTKKLNESERNKLIERTNKILFERTKNIDPLTDMYYVNPEEARQHFLEIQNLYSVRNIIKYYENYKGKLFIWNSKNFLNYIKNMFNELLSTQVEDYVYVYDFINYFLNDDDILKIIELRKTDSKFKEQIAKHFNNVYQKLKEYFGVNDEESSQNIFKEQNENLAKSIESDKINYKPDVNDAEIIPEKELT